MRRLYAAIVLIAAASAAGVFVFSDDASEDRPESREAAERSGDDADTDPETVPYRPWVFERGRYAVEFVHPATGRGVPVSVHVGAPGLWPPQSDFSDADGRLDTPALELRTFTGRRVPTREVVARSRTRSLAAWQTIELGPDAADPVGRIVRLEPASPIRVRVLDPDGEPLASARLHLARDALSLTGLSGETDASGRHTFEAIPEGRYAVSAESDALTGRHSTDHRGSGATDLTVRTSRSTSETSTSPRSPTEPRSVRVGMDGLTAEEWRRVTVLWRRGQTTWRAAQLTDGDSPAERVWSGRLPEGQYGLRAQTRSGAFDTSGFQVDEDGVELDWTISLSVAFDVYTTDAQGAPVDGALVQLWSEGEMRKTAISRGEEPVSMRFAVGERHRLVAFDGRLGEGETRLEPSFGAREGRDATVSLDRESFSVSRPPDRLTETSAIEEEFGATLTRSRSRWLVDTVRSGSPAARADLRRGDGVLSVHRSDGEMRALIERDERIFEVGPGP